MRSALDRFKIKIIILQLTVFLTVCSGICYKVYWYYPVFLSSSYTRCFSYFSLDRVPLALVDQLNNQGEDVFAFGEKVYFFGGLDESQVNTLSKDMIKKGAIETADKIVLTKQRGEIIGEFKLFKEDFPAQIIVSYKEFNSL